LLPQPLLAQRAAGCKLLHSKQRAGIDSIFSSLAIGIFGQQPVWRVEMCHGLQQENHGTGVLNAYMENRLNLHLYGMFSGK
jgi:hypothetical protein